MMRLSFGILLAGILSTAAPNAVVQQGNCPQFTVPQKSFRHVVDRVYVWVDDIESKFPVGYKPFELVVVIGGAYAPFGTQQGSLERAPFERLMKTARLNDRKPLRVSADEVARGAELSFQSNQRQYRLRVVKVDPSYTGVDKVILQLCQ